MNGGKREEGRKEGVDDTVTLTWCIYECKLRWLPRELVVE